MDESLDTTVKSFPAPTSNLVTQGSNSVPLPPLNGQPILVPLSSEPKPNIWLSTILPLITLFVFLILPSVVAITAINLNHNNVSINVSVPPVNQPQPRQPSTPNTPPTVSPKTQTIVQLGSYRSIAEAKTFIKKLKINDAIDISQVHIYKATLPTGVWYRVALPVSDVNVGSDMCSAYKALGNDCLVLTLNVI